MCIDVCCCAEIRVSKPFLNLLHRYTVLQKHRRAGVTEIVKSDMPHTVTCKELRKGFAQIVWWNDIAHFIDADIFKIFRIVAATAYSLVFFLHLPSLQKQRSELRYQRECSAARLGFRRVGRHFYIFAVDFARCKCVLMVMVFC